MGGGGKIGYGIATSGGVRYLIEGRGFEVKNTATSAWVGKYTIRSVNMVTKAVAWTKTFTNGPSWGWINPRRCRVTGIDGDGNDEVVVLHSQMLSSTTARKYLDVFNLATGVAKRATLTWNE